MQDRFAWLHRNQRLAAFSAAFLLFLVLHYIYDVQRFRWDAALYWRLSSIDSLSNFPSVIRGYFYPLLLAPSRWLCDLFPAWGYAPFRVLSSAGYAYALTILLPEFYQGMFGGTVSFWRRLVAPALVCVVYPGLIVTTLSDLPAVCLMLAAIVCGVRSVTHEGKSAARYGLLLLCGIMVYGAYNTRTIFLFPALLMLLAVPLVLYRGRERSLRAAALSMVLAGIVVAGIPQLLINVKNHGIWSPAVVTTAEDKSLFARQLLWGVTVQRYETTVDKAVPGPEVFYPDPAGESLYDSLDVDTKSFTVTDYLGLLVRHPLDFAGIYARHFVNGLDVRDGEAYTTSQSTAKDGFAFCNFLVVFLGLSLITAAAFAHPPTDAASRIRWFWALVALVPVLAIIPGAIETRFFLALHLAFYCAIAFSMDLRAASSTLKRHWLPAALTFCVAAGIFFSITLSAMAGVEYGPHRVHLTTDAGSTQPEPAD